MILFGDAPVHRAFAWGVEARGWGKDDFSAHAQKIGTNRGRARSSLVLKVSEMARNSHSERRTATTVEEILPKLPKKKKKKK